ncbi:sensor histidine kinase [Sphaerisporangium perillae]|uniref:sensor histidine kinase n=1 Tax=Sphaerisporangium perillae TaxID=2935860 RepID=UPI0027E117C5|nr:HAMP domain-containing sensor histidine kinase [Sphaerisporangium perillae]
MSEEHDAVPADAGRPSFSAPQPVIVPPGSPLPPGVQDSPGALGPAALSVRAGTQGMPAAAGAGGAGTQPLTGTAGIRPAQQSSAAEGPPKPPGRPGSQTPSGAEVLSGGPWRSEQPTVESARHPFRTKTPPPPPSGPPAWDGPPPISPNPVAENLLARLRRITGRMSIRVRLTLTYGALFFAAGALLLFVIYSFVGKAIWDSWPDFPFNLEDYPPAVAAGIQDRWANFRADTIVAARHQLLIRSLLALGGVGILALVFGYFVADRALRPIQKMTTTARRLSETSLAHERIDLDGPNDEIKELADTFDAMLTRLNRAFDAQRRFVDNASHELRTPLAINRTVLEVALGDSHASEDLKVLGRTLLGTNARNEHLIEGLLLLARSERELATRKPVDLRDVGQTVVEQHASFAEESGVTVHTDLRPGPTMGDPVLVERLVANLVENAIKHNLPESGEVWLRTGMVDGTPVVQVANTGPHVPAYEVDDLFEPFRRLHSDRVESARGAGLGLSIVRAVVRAHHGTVKAIPRDGGGLVMTVRLPAG